MSTYMMLAVIVLNIFVISNMIKTNVSLRTKEIGMLRSIGAEKKWVKKSICCEIMMLTIKAVIAGTIVATPVSVYIYSIINETMRIGIWGYVIGIPVIMIGSYFVSRIMVGRCLKNGIGELIRCE